MVSIGFDGAARYRPGMVLTAALGHLVVFVQILYFARMVFDIAVLCSLVSIYCLVLYAHWVSSSSVVLRASPLRTVC